MTQLALHPDRFLPADPATRRIARELYAHVATFPIISPHGHVDAALIAANQPFGDPAALLITPDHYVTRLLHASGVPLEQLGLRPREHRHDHPGTAPAGTELAHTEPAPAQPSAHEVWRTFCAHWDTFLGTPVRAWFEHTLSTVFGVTEQPDRHNADALFQQLSEVLATPAFRPQALLERFNIAILATTDDPADTLQAHRSIQHMEIPTRVLPTFRADRYMHADAPGWAGALEQLATASGVSCGTYTGLLEALRLRRQVFAEHGATSTDTGVVDAGCEPLPEADAERLHALALRGELDPAAAAAYRRNLLYQFAAMSADDGLVMQLHPGVVRNHHSPTFHRFGPDTGHDIPVRTSFTNELQPILRDFGTNERFRLVLFTVDETTFSREIAPLAGFYPSVFAGAPWWFLDAPAAMLRFRAAVTETAGFHNTSGFIDDTRAFCSIPARHDLSRRVDARFLAELVVTHQLSQEHAADIARQLVSDIPLRTFRL